MKLTNIWSKTKRKVSSFINKKKTADFSNIDESILKDIDEHAAQVFVPGGDVIVQPEPEIDLMKQTITVSKIADGKEIAKTVYPLISENDIVCFEGKEIKITKSQLSMIHGMKSASNKINYQKQKSQQKNWSKWKKKL